MTPDQICFVINAQSHRVKRHGSKLGQLSGAFPGIHVLRLDDFSALGQQIGTLADQGVLHFFIEGGDGTVLAVLSACASQSDRFQTPTEFAILPGGSTNLAAKQVGFRARNQAALKERVRAMIDGTPPTVKEQRALSIHWQDLPNPIVGFLLSTGFLARAMSFVQREFHGDGRRGSLAVATAILRFITAPDKYLDRDGQPVLRGSDLSFNAGDLSYTGPHGLSLMTSFDRLSLGLNPFWGDQAGPIAHTYTHWPMPHFRRQILSALFNKNADRLAQKGLFSHRAERIELTLEDPLMVDGELFTPPKGSKVLVTPTDPIRFLV